MRNLDYHEIVHEGEGEYAIDFSNYAHNRYKQCDGLRVYENGAVIIEPHAYRNPWLREQLRNHYGLNVRLLSEFRGINFFTEDGVRVAKDDIDADAYLHDERYNKLFRVNGWRGHGLRLYGPHAQFLTTSDDSNYIRISLPDHGYVNAVLAAAPHETLALARSYYEMNSDVGPPHLTVVSGWFRCNPTWPTFPDGIRDGQKDWLLAMGWLLSHRDLRRSFLFWSRTRKRVPYLLTKERNAQSPDVQRMHGYVPEAQAEVSQVQL